VPRLTDHTSRFLTLALCFLFGPSVRRFMALTFPSHTPLRSTTEALAAALAACKPGAKVVDICNLGDKTVEEEAAKFYNKKDKDGNKIEKGIAFPTCISVNHQVCHNSPPSDDATVLEEGQAVKIDLGAHVDG